MKQTKKDYINEIVEFISYEGITDYELSVSLQMIGYNKISINNILTYGNIEKALDLKLQKYDLEKLHNVITNMKFEQYTQHITENDIYVLEDLKPKRDNLIVIASKVVDEFSIKQISEIKYHSVKLIETAESYIENTHYKIEELLPEIQNIFKIKLKHHYGKQLELF